MMTQWKKMHDKKSKGKEYLRKGNKYKKRNWSNSFKKVEQLHPIEKLNFYKREKENKKTNRKVPVEGNQKETY